MEAETEERHVSGDFTKNVQCAQAQAIHGRTRATAFTNAFVSASTFSVEVVNAGFDTKLTLWFAALLSTLLLRICFAIWIGRRKMIDHDPQKALRLMVTGALLTGLVWGALPWCVAPYVAGEKNNVIYLVMCGIATGSILTGLGHSLTSLAFAMPTMLGATISIIFHYNTAAWLIALAVIILTVVLFRSSLYGEKSFVGSVLGTLQAKALANSLSDANADIMRANSKLEALASRDPLTGLANRTTFNTALQSGIEAALEKNEQLALLVLDLDNFKTINDTLGHSAGDALLLEVSDRLRALVNGNGVIARLGGDEFAIIIGGADTPARARALCEQILQRSNQPAFLDGQPAVVGTSIGLALFPDHATNAEDFFINADMALYEAKDGGRRRWREFDPALRLRINRQHQIEQELPKALATGSIEAWFQPQVDLNSNEIIGFEALIRWHHPSLGPIAPPEIVAAAQVTNLAERLTAMVAKSACRLINRLPSLGLPRATVAINVSASEFALYSITSTLNRITKAHSINPGLFEIEITEEAMLDTVVAGEELKRIERSGYKLAVDDFGTGHSSLAYLVQLKIDRLKLDRCFVAGIQASQNQEIIAAMVVLGRSLSMQVLVEGVESQEEADTLRALGVRVAQGYFLGRPMPAQRIAGWIESRCETAQKAIA